MNKHLFLMLFIFTTFTAQASDYYWVGGTGNWSAFATHWATTSGGSTFYTEIPRSTDNVFFDANSFTAPGQAVTIDVPTVTIVDMGWTGVTNNPTFNRNNKAINLNGSLTFVSGMALTNSGGALTFGATTTGKTITMGGKSISGGSTVFNGIGGSWLLTDSWSGTTALFLTNGSISTANNITMNVDAFLAAGSNTGRSLAFGANNILNTTRAVDLSGYAIDFSGTGLTVTGTSTLTLNVTSSGTGDINGGNYTFYNVSHAGNGRVIKNGRFNNVSFTNTLDNQGQTDATLNDATAAAVTFATCGNIQNVTATSVAFGSSNGSTVFLNGTNNVPTITVAGNAGIYDNSNGSTYGTLTVSGTTSTNCQFSGGNNNTYTTITLPGSALIDGGTFTTANIGGAFTGRASGTTTFGTLNLTAPAGTTHKFAPNKTITITTALTINDGRCSTPSVLGSNTAGTQATLSLSDAVGDITLNYFNVSDLKVVGTKVYTINNANNLGNNTGWVINGRAALNLYWIGGTGNWSDGSHWSTTSGGSAIGCGPSLLDNVYFDANSFTATGQTVTIDVTSVTIVDMDWTGVTNNPTLNWNSKTINLNGSLTFVSGMTITNMNTLNLGATTSGKTITVAGKSLGGTTKFNCVGGSWFLTDSWSGATALFLTNGSISTANNITINADAFLVAGSNTGRSLAFGTNNILNTTRAVDLSGYAIDLSGTGLTVTGTATLTLNTSSGNINGGNYTFGNATSSGNGIKIENGHFNNVSFTNSSSSGAQNAATLLNATAAAVTFASCGNIQNVTATSVAFGSSSNAVFLNGTNNVPTITVAGSGGFYDNSYASTYGTLTVSGTTSTNCQLSGGNNNTYTTITLPGSALIDGGTFTTANIGGAFTGRASGTTTFGTLNLTAAGSNITHQFAANKTITINTALNISGGTGGNPIYLKSTTAVLSRLQQVPQAHTLFITTFHQQVADKPPLL